MERLPLVWEGCALSYVGDKHAANLKGCQQDKILKQSGFKISVNSALGKSLQLQEFQEALAAMGKLLDQMWCPQLEKEVMRISVILKQLTKGH